MKLIRGNDFLNFKANNKKGCALAIGNFDGIHKGHQEILKQLRLIATRDGLETAVMLFNPNPKVYFAKQKNIYAPKKVLPLKEQLILLSKYGIDNVFLMRFNNNLSNLSPDDFIKEYLLDKLMVKHLVVGEDFRFGHKGAGDYSLLKKYSLTHDLLVSESEILLLNSNKISSTWIRKCLNDGDFKNLKQILGREYSLSGKVAYGNQLGRKIGFATLNIKMPENICLSGVFCVKVEYKNKIINGVANIGFRPTINKSNNKSNNKNKCVLEVHLFDFNQQIYGESVRVFFYKKLREEKKFPGLEDLKKQLSKDVNSAKNFFIEPSVS